VRRTGLAFCPLLGSLKAEAPARGEFWLRLSLSQKEERPTPLQSHFSLSRSRAINKTPAGATIPAGEGLAVTSQKHSVTGRFVVKRR
jgi:hypothetical protein